MGGGNGLASEMTVQSAGQTFEIGLIQMLKRTMKEIGRGSEGHLVPSPGYGSKIEANVKWSKNEVENEVIYS